MSKNHRGTGIRTLPAHGRATCPICKRDGVKCLYEQEVDGKTVNICKVCKAALKNKARIEAKNAAAVAPAAEEAPASAESTADAQ